MEFGPQAGGEAHARQVLGLFCVRVQSDAERLLCHGNNELAVGAQAVALGGLQVDADEQVVVAAAQRARQVSVLNGIEKL